MHWAWTPTTSRRASSVANTKTPGYQDSIMASKLNSTSTKPLKSCLKKRVPTKANDDPETLASIAVEQLKGPHRLSKASYQDFMTRFSRREELNEGSTGVATSAFDSNTGKVVVLKQYLPRHGNMLDRMHRSGTLTTHKHRMLLDEVFLHRSKASPHIIDLIDSFKDPQCPSRTTLVLEYAEHGDLLDYLNRRQRAHKSAPEALIWHWMLQMAKAVHFLHDSLGEHTIIHCDIKPENWLLTAPRQRSILYPAQSSGQLPPWAFPDIKLADFDLARFDGDGPKSCTTGTPVCQPPEYPRDTKAGDVWAVGACVHLAVTGSFPIQPPECGWAVFTRESELLRYEIDAPRRADDVRRYGYSSHLQEVFEGRHVVSAVPGHVEKHGGMLNLDATKRFTAAQLVDAVEGIMVEKWQGKGEDCGLNEWAFPEIARGETVAPQAIYPLVEEVDAEDSEGSEEE